MLQGPRAAGMSSQFPNLFSSHLTNVPVSHCVVPPSDKFSEANKANSPPFGNTNIPPEIQRMMAPPWSNPTRPFVAPNPHSFTHYDQIGNMNHQYAANQAHLPSVQQPVISPGVLYNYFQRNGSPTLNNQAPLGQCELCRRIVHVFKVVLNKIVCNECVNQYVHNNLLRNNILDNNVSSSERSSNQNDLQPITRSTVPVKQLDGSCLKSNSNDEENLDNDMRLIGDLPPPPPSCISPPPPLLHANSSLLPSVPVSGTNTSVTSVQNGGNYRGTHVCQFSDVSTSDSSYCLICGSFRTYNIQPSVSSNRDTTGTTVHRTNAKTVPKSTVESLLDLTEESTDGVDLVNLQNIVPTNVLEIDEAAFFDFINQDSSSNDHPLKPKVDTVTTVSCKRQTSSPGDVVYDEDICGDKRPKVPKITVNRDHLQKLRNKVTPILKAKNWIKENSPGSSIDQLSENDHSK